MALRLLRLPIELPTVDETRFPDLDKSLVQQHLTHYLAKCEVLPAITVEVQSDSVVVTRGHKYLVSARELGLPSIRAVVTPTSDSASVDGLREQPGVEELSWNDHAHDNWNDQMPVWHILFFAAPIGERDRLELQQRLRLLRSASTLPDSEIEVESDEALRMMAFRMVTPAFDREWGLSLLKTLVDYGRECVPILSHQGLLWQFKAEVGAG